MEPSISPMLQLGNRDRREVLSALFDHVIRQNNVLFEAMMGLSLTEAERILAQASQVDEIHGVPMGLRFKGRLLDPSGYDRLYGAGTAAWVISQLGQGMEAAAVAGLTLPSAAVPVKAESEAAAICCNLMDYAAECETGDAVRANLCRMLAERLREAWIAAGREITPASFFFLILESLDSLHHGLDVNRIGSGRNANVEGTPKAADALYQDLSVILSNICPACFTAEVRAIMDRIPPWGLD